VNIVGVNLQLHPDRHVCEVPVNEDDAVLEHEACDAFREFCELRTDAMQVGHEGCAWFVLETSAGFPSPESSH
jgi:hypothetical protein